MWCYLETRCIASLQYLPDILMSCFLDTWVFCFMVLCGVIWCYVVLCRVMWRRDASRLHNICQIFSCHAFLIHRCFASWCYVVLCGVIWRRDASRLYNICQKFSCHAFLILGCFASWCYVVLSGVIWCYLVLSGDAMYRVSAKLMLFIFQKLIFLRE